MGGPSEGLTITRSGLPSGQLRAELDWLIDLFRREGVTSYLEIGARSGDTFWEIANSLPVGSKVVAVDLPNSHWGYEHSEPALDACIHDLRELGYNADFILGSSQHPNVKFDVYARGKFDATLIDGDHTLAGVRADWEVYGPLTNKLVAFHDIGWKRPSGGTGRIEVPELWAELSANRRHEQIITTPQDCGIGVVWV